MLEILPKIPRSGIVCVAALALGLFLAAKPLTAQPSGGQVIAGGASISGGPGGLTITQTSSRAIIDWQSFSLAKGDAVRFAQPGATSATLNRVISGQPSSLEGTLQANGRVYLINPNGILVGSGAHIDVGGFLASTLGVANEEFLAGGALHFSGASTAAVTNRGTISTNGGDLFLIGRRIENTGTLTATGGTAGLAAGSEVLVTTGSDQRIFVQALSLPGEIANTGTIAAAANELKAAGGNAYALAINNTGLVRATGTAEREGQLWLVASDTGLVTNAGTLDASSATGAGGHIVATGGRVLLDNGTRLDATGATQGGTVRVGGGWQGVDAAVPNASSVVMQSNASIDVSATKSGAGGTAVLWSDSFTRFSGQIAARGAGAGGAGGNVETSSHGTLQAEGTVDAGTSGHWLLDPRDVTIASSGASGTAYADVFTPTADSVILASSVAGALNGGNNVTITTGSTGASAGDINVNAPVSWSTNTTLTLSAQNNVRVNANLTASGDTAGLVLTPNASGGFNGTFSVNNRAAISLSGATPSLMIAGLGYTVINQLGVEGDATSAPATPTLQGLAATANLGGRFALGSDIDASDTANWNIVNFSPTGFTPIGTAAHPFTGTFDGLGHSVSNITISQPAGSNVGLFGYLGNGGTINRTQVTNAYVLGKSSVGGLVGYNAGSIHTSFTSGTVTGPGGHLFTSDSVGGLAGTNGNIIDGSYSSASVSGTDKIGGLVGYNDEGAIQNVYATGDVSGATNVGGLVGYNHSYLGSLATLEDVYALGSVTGSTAVGGVVGYNDNGDVLRAYATGAVSGGSSVGGLVGEDLINDVYGHGITSSYWNTETTGQSAAVGVENGQTQFSFGRTSAEMLQMASFPDFNITNTGGTNGAIWRIYEGFTTPWLTCFLFPVTVTASSDTKTYNGLAYTGGNGITYSLPTLSPALSGTAAFGGTSQSAVNAGSYAITLSGLYSVQQGYDISFAPGVLTVNKADLTLSGTRSYDGTTLFAGSLLTAAGVNGETFTVTGGGASGNLAAKNIQTAAALSTVTGLSLGASSNGGLTGNYNSLSTLNSAVAVTAANLTVTTSDVVKTYDGTTTAVGSPVITVGQLYGSDVLASGPLGPTYAFVGKDVGIANKTVTISGIGVNDGNSGHNYALTLADNTTSTINKADLTLGGTRVYDGTTLFAGGNLTATGVNGETFTLTGAGLSGDLSTKDVQTNQTLASVGGLALGSGNSGAALASNYNALATTGSSVSVTPAALVLTGTRIYDGTTSFAGGNLTASGVNGESFAITGAGASGNLSTKNVQTSQSLATVSGLALGSGNSGAAISTNYHALSTTNSSVSVTPRVLTIAGFTAPDKVYDGTTSAVITTPGTLTGVVSGDSVGFTHGGATFDTKDVGSGKMVTLAGVTLTGSGDESNYTYTATTTDLSDITPATLTYTADLVQRLYGSANPAFSGAVTGFANGETLGTATTGSAAFASAATPADNVGHYGIVGSGLTANHGNYSFVQASSNATALTINPAPLTITADNTSRAIGVANPPLTATYSGFVNGETAGVVSGLSLATTANLASPGGTYPITAAGATAPNYAISFVDGLLTIGQNLLTITADDKSKIYGAALPAFTASFSGFVNGDTAGLVTGLQFNSTASASANVGTYAITPFGATAPGYTLAYVPGTLTINPAALTLSANSADRLYGAPNPAFTASYAGLVNGDTAAVVSGLTLDTPATVASGVGTYAITPANGSAINYVLTYVPGTLTIDPALLTIAAKNASRTYGASNPGFGATFSGFVNGDDFTLIHDLGFTTPATVSSSVGTYAIVPSGATATNYHFAYIPGTLTIDPAALTITADNATRVYGVPNPSFTASFAGLLNGDTANVVSGLTLTTPAISTSSIGDYPIIPNGAEAANYTITYHDGTLQVAAPVVTVDSTPSSVVTIDGEPASSPGLAVVDVGGRRTLVPVDTTSGSRASDSLDARVTAELGEVSGLPSRTGSDAPANAASASHLISGPNFGPFELVASVAAQPGGAVNDSLSPAQLADPGLYREATLNMGGYKVIYHEAVVEGQQQHAGNAAEGSSYREFPDTDLPRIDIVRGGSEQSPGNKTENSSANGGQGGAR